MLLLRALQSIGRLINSVHWLRPGRLRGTRDLGDAQPTVVGGREQRMGTGSATAYRYATEESGADMKLDLEPASRHMENLLVDRVEVPQSSRRSRWIDGSLAGAISRAPASLPSGCSPGI